MTRPLNIIYVLTDQQRRDTLSCYRNPIVKTPHLDELAAKGILFENAFTPSSICGPARASLFTGLFPTSHGVVGNPHSVPIAPMDLRPGVRGLPDFLPGYDLMLIGKWHVEETRLPSDFGFQGHDFKSYGFPGSGVYPNFTFDADADVKQTRGKNRYTEWLEVHRLEIPNVLERHCGKNPDFQTQELYAKLSGTLETTIDYFLVDEAKTILSQRTDTRKPFFMWLNFWGPHTPCVIPEPYYSMYDPESIPVEQSFTETFEDKPVHHKHISQKWGLYELDWNEWAKIVARYYGYITLIDHCLGEFITYLKEQGLWDQTLFVFTSDHGDAMGAHRLIEKGGFMFDETYRLPMIAHHPRCMTSGKVFDEFVYLHDLCPTAAEIATGQDPNLGESVSLLPLLEGKSFHTGRDSVFGQFLYHFTFFAQRMVRTKDYKLVFNATTRGELYDLKLDPSEMINQIDNPSYTSIKQDLVGKLRQHMEKISDPMLTWFREIGNYY